MGSRIPIPPALFFNANLIISSIVRPGMRILKIISLDDLAAVLRDNKEHLYSYTSVQESHDEVTTEDPETGEETTTTETWIIYDPV